MTRVSIIMMADGPVLHVIHTGGPIEDRPMSRDEVARLMAEVAEAWLWLSQRAARSGPSGPP